MTDDETIDKIVALWKQADEHSDQADLLHDESENQQKMAEDLENEAEALSMPLIASHPEWRDGLMAGEDPRISESESRALDGNR